MHGCVRWLAGAAGAVALAVAVPGTAAADSAPLAAPQLAVQPDGRAHFAWDWFDGRAPVVQETSRSAAGDYFEPQWVSPAGLGAITSDVATDGAGNAAIVWLGAYGPVVRMRWREADGSLRATQTLSNAGAVAADAQAAVDPAGTTYATWVELLPGDRVSVVRARRRAADGTLGAVETLSATTGKARLPRVVVDGLGNAVFAWQRRISGGATVVQARRRAADGTLSAIQTLSATTGTHHDVDLGLDEGGAAIVSWLRHAGGATGVQLRRRAVNGTLGAIQALTAPVADHPSLGPLIEDPRIAVAPDGAATVSWMRDPGVDSNPDGGLIRVRRRSPSGALSAIQTLNTSGHNGFRPRIAADPNGTVTVVWVSDGGYQQLAAYARRRTAAGVLGEETGASHGGLYVSAADVAMDAAGNAIVAYAAVHESGDPEIGAMRLAANGAPGDIELLAP